MSKALVASMALAAACGTLFAVAPKDALAVAGAVGFCWLLLRVRVSAIEMVALSIVLTANVAVPVLQLQGNTGYLVVTTVGVVATLTAVLRTSSSANMSTFAIKALAAFAALACLSVKTHPDTHPGQAYAGLILMICAVVLGSRLQPPQQVAFLRVVVATGLLEAAYAVVEVAGNRSPLWVGAYQSPNGSSAALPSDLLNGLSRAQGTLGHPIPLAALLLVSLAVVMSGIAIRRRTLRALCVAVLVTGLLLTGTRSALLLLPLTLVLSIPFRSNTNRAIAIGSALLAILLYAVSTGNLTQTVGLTDVQSSGSYTHRLGALDGLWRMVHSDSTFQFLFGHGYLSIVRLFNEGILQTDGLHTVDNQFVETFAQLGLIGVVVLTVIFTRALLRSSGVVRVGLLIIVSDFLIFDVLDRPSIFVLGFALVGFAEATARPHIETLEPQPRGTGKQQWVCATPSIMTGVGRRSG